MVDPLATQKVVMVLLPLLAGFCFKSRHPGPWTNIWLLEDVNARDTEPLIYLLVDTYFQLATGTVGVDHGNEMIFKLGDDFLVFIWQLGWWRCRNGLEGFNQLTHFFSLVNVNSIDAILSIWDAEMSETSEKFVLPLFPSAACFAGIRVRDKCLHSDVLWSGRRMLNSLCGWCRRGAL